MSVLPPEETSITSCRSLSKLIRPLNQFNSFLKWFPIVKSNAISVKVTFEQFYITNIALTRREVILIKGNY